MLLAAISTAIASIFLLLVLLAAFDINNKKLMIFCAVMMPLFSISVGMAVAGLFGFIATFLWFVSARHVESDMKKAKDAA